MYLKRLEIQGFKSFANRTVLDFLPPKDGNFSITAVVGPNGSGKSNVTDAIRWVMGEQSMKNIRSKKSEDVIFSGSESRGALSAAEVVMTLDNVDDKAEVGAEEVVVVRRLFRSGESQYLINNNPARLLDVHLLMAKSQFAEHAYSIVSQGMIDRLLTVSPAERKEFFDEASGIKELYIKRHQAFLKMERTKEHIAQAQTIIQEIEPRLKLLSRQLKKLEEREEIESQLRSIQETYYFTVYSKHQEDVLVLHQKLHDIDGRYRSGFGSLELIQNELAELARVVSRQEIFESLQQEHQNLVREKNKLEKEIAILEGQMHVEYSQSGKQNVGWLESKIDEGKNLAQQQSIELSRLENDANKLKNSLQEVRKHCEDVAITKSQTMLKISRLQNEMLKSQSEQQYRDFSGLTAVKAVLDHKKHFGEVHGLVADLGEVDSQFQLALEVAAAAHLNSIVVADEVVARKAIDFLRQGKFGFATFLPLNKIQEKSFYHDDESFLHYSGVHGYALKLIRFDKKFQAIFSFIFGSTFVVDTLQVAESIGVGRIRMVTLAGDLVEKTGVMRGGFRQRRPQVGFSSKTNFSSEDRLGDFQKEILLEENCLRDYEKTESTLKEQAVLFQVELETMRNKMQLLVEQKNKGELEFAQFEREYAVIKSNPEEYTDKLQQFDKEKKSLHEMISALNTSIQQAEEKMAQFNDEEEKKKQRIFSLQEAMQVQQQQVNAVLNERNDVKVELAKLETKQEDLVQELFNDMGTSIASLAERSPAIVPLSELDALANEIQKCKYKLSLIGGIDQEVVKEHAETKERFDFLNSQVSDLEKASHDLNYMVAELDELMKKKRSQAFKKIRKEFNRYFQILFEGGQADLEEIYGEENAESVSDEVVSEVSGAESIAVESEEQNKSARNKNRILTGIEVVANPPGKKIKYLNALSGGERTLTSIALICAILHHNPSPFVVLDEVEAALDESNTLRFVRIMKELSRESQFILITHNRVTMHAADALYGVVMHQDGISKLLSVKLGDLEEYETASS
jgi:chromosome segregation protein